jgi:drug/metabolite transporter (DMT)-like permease
MLILGESLTLERALGIIICVGGVAWLALQTPQAKEVRGASFSGVIFALCASLLWAGNVYCIRRGSMDLPLWSANALRYALTVTALGSAFAALRWHTKQTLGGEPIRQVDAGVPPVFTFVGAVLLEACLGSLMIVYAFSHAQLGIATTLASLAPLFALPIGVAMGTERFQWSRLIPMSATIVGVVLVLRGAG